ncbi:MAG: hypothetical protein KAG92_07710, partial [Deltaproteobacteria bacterium]|nr:hypothetical protein [Deltaproteobacteria bacterium]
NLHFSTNPGMAKLDLLAGTNWLKIETNSDMTGFELFDTTTQLDGCARKDQALLPFFVLP